MDNARFQALCLTCIGFICILTSCGYRAKQADALVTVFGQAAGIVVEYNTAIDKASVNKETFRVDGKKVMTVFVSDSNNLKQDEGKDKDEDNGRYAIILLYPPTSTSEADELQIAFGGEAPKLNIGVKQVAPVKTTKGKVINPWKKALKTKDSYFVEGWLKK